MPCGNSAESLLVDGGRCSVMNAGKCLDPRLSAIIHQKSELIILQQLQNQNSNWTFAVYCCVLTGFLCQQDGTWTDMLDTHTDTQSGHDRDN